MTIQIFLVTCLQIEGALCLVSCGGIYDGQSLTKEDRQGSSWVVDSVMSDFEKSRPWESSPSFTLNRGERRNLHKQDDDSAMKWIRESSFKPGEDEADDLLKQARSNSPTALNKLDDYVMNYNREWPGRFEIMKIRAVLTGADGLAVYYSATTQHRHLRMEKRSIENGIRMIEEQASRGSWKHAAALYHLHGRFGVEGMHLPWGGTNEEMSAKWLDVAYRFGGMTTLDKVVYYEKLVSGWVKELNKQSYPHTPPGWQPSCKSIRGAKSASVSNNWQRFLPEFCGANIDGTNLPALPEYLNPITYHAHRP